MRKNTGIVGVAVACRKSQGKYRWFLAKQTEEGDWELPKAQSRRGESSVRATIRNLGERGGLRARVLEEVGRGSGVAKIGNQKLPQKYLYYFVVAKDTGEPIGFIDTVWLEYGQAVKKLVSERDKRMLKKAKEMIHDLRKEERIR